MQNRPVEVVLIAGFLGAGKTTFLRNILSWPGRLPGTAILVNEFGRIGIDGQLPRGLRYARGGNGQRLHLLFLAG